MSGNFPFEVDLILNSSSKRIIKNKFTKGKEKTEKIKKIYVTLLLFVTGIFARLVCKNTRY